MIRHYRSVSLLLAACLALPLLSSCKEDSPQGIQLPKIIDEGAPLTPQVVDLRLDKRSLELAAEVGQTAQETLHVTQGNGSYTATSSSEQVSVQVAGSDLTIVATATAEAYTATVTVSDKAGKTAEVSLRVSPIEVQPAPVPEEPAPTPTPAPEPTPTPAPVEPAPAPAPEPEPAPAPAPVEMLLEDTSVRLSARAGQSAMATLRITQGNGGYSVTSSDPQVTASIADATITIRATAKAQSYTAKLTVTDQLGKASDIRVEVTTEAEPAPAPTPAPVTPAPAPEQPAAVEVTLDKTSLELTAEEGEEAHAVVNILSGNGGYQAQVQGSNIRARIDGGATVTIFARATKTAYTDYFTIIDRLGKRQTVMIKVTPKAKASPSPTPGSSAPKVYTDEQLRNFEKSAGATYVMENGSTVPATSGSLVMHSGGKQTIGVNGKSLGKSIKFRLVYTGSLAVGTYADAKLTYDGRGAKQNETACTVVITKVEGGRFWGYFYGTGFKGHFCDKVK